MMKLQEWFESEERDYGIGLALLGSHCKNRILLQNLARKQNPGKLEYELKKALDREKESAVPAEAETGTETGTFSETGADTGKEKAEGNKDEISREKLIIIRNEKEVKYEGLPEDIQKLWDENRDAYKEIRALHEKLKLMENATPEDRQSLTERITVLDELIRKNWEVIDAWQPGQEPERTEQPAIDHKRINSNRKYISTNMKKLAESKNEALRAKIQERVDELKAAGEKLTDKTIEELKTLGIII